MATNQSIRLVKPATNQQPIKIRHQSPPPQTPCNNQPPSAIPKNFPSHVTAHRKQKKKKKSADVSQTNPSFLTPDSTPPPPPPPPRSIPSQALEVTRHMQKQMHPRNSSVSEQGTPLRLPFLSNARMHESNESKSDK